MKEVTYPLNLFNEKAGKLANSSFMKFIKEKKKLSFEISAKKGEHVRTKRTLQIGRAHV